MTRHVLITGSTKGIGNGLARNFLKSGLKVTINGRSKDSVNSVVANLNSKNIQGFAGDMTNPKEVEELCDKSVEGFGKIDIWINNAGKDQCRGMIWELPPNEIDRVLDLNIKGMIYGTQVAFRHMLKNGGGWIFNMEGFGSNDMYQPGVSLYGTSKRALTYFTRSFVREVKGTNVRVGLLSPGMVMTDLLVGELPTDPKELRTFKKVVNILADEVDTVTPFLVNRILSAKKNGIHIQWLTKRKASMRFLFAPFSRRDLFTDHAISGKKIQ